jgi:hypothetical protein
MSDDFYNAMSIGLDGSVLNGQHSLGLANVVVGCLAWLVLKPPAIHADSIRHRMQGAKILGHHVAHKHPAVAVNWFVHDYR